MNVLNTVHDLPMKSNFVWLWAISSVSLGTTNLHWKGHGQGGV